MSLDGLFCISLILKVVIAILVIIRHFVVATVFPIIITNAGRKWISFVSTKVSQNQPGRCPIRGVAVAHESVQLLLGTNIDFQCLWFMVFKQSQRKKYKK